MLNKQNRNNKKKKGFTLLEFILAIFLSSLLLLFVYQTYYQVVKYFKRDHKEEEHFFLFTSALEYQIKNKSCKYYLTTRNKKEKLYVDEKTLAFITNYSPGEPLVVIYKFSPLNTEFWEIKLKEINHKSIEELIEEKKPLNFKVKATFELKEIFLSAEGEQETKNIETDIDNLSQKNILITIKGPHNLKKDIIWTECKQ